MKYKAITPKDIEQANNSLNGGKSIKMDYDFCKRDFRQFLIFEALKGATHFYTGDKQTRLMKACNNFNHHLQNGLAEYLFVFFPEQFKKDDEQAYWHAAEANAAKYHLVG